MKIAGSWGKSFRHLRSRAQRYILLSAVVSFLLAVTISNAAAQATQPVDPKHDHPFPGTRITRFQKIEEGVYKGSEPKNDADYRFLQSQHIKYIVVLKFMPLLYRIEVHKARKYGILVIPVTMNASTFAPSEKHVRQVLCLLSDKRLRPVYFHCTVGRDRTALIATLYEIYFLGLPPEKAREEMNRFGFKNSWTLSGLSGYLQKHASSPWENSKDKCRHFPLPSSDKETK
jgi:protein-tyrosine phosphatase